jgi:betaine-homocysteine S-methyltransferase
MAESSESLLERLEQGPVLVAEGYLFELERRGYLKAGPFVPEVVLRRPEAVQELHLEFLRAGSEVAVAFTYYGHRAKLRSIGQEDKLEPLNFKALDLARQTAGAFGALTAGNLSNTWEYDPENPQKSTPACRAIFEEQARWAADAGMDFIIAETFSHLGEALLALEEIKRVGLPAVVTFMAVQEKTCDGYSFDEACRVLEEHGADVVGLNCGRGPATMLPLLKKIRKKVQCHVAAMPVPYRTTKKYPTFHFLKQRGQKSGFPVGLDPFVLTRYEMADYATIFRDLDIRYMGVCCGGAPHHVRAMAEALGRTVPASEFSAAMDLHPVFGDGDKVKSQYRECWFGPREGEK